jgi:hypothetical protein
MLDHNDAEFCAGNSGKLRNRLHSCVENLKKSWGTEVAKGALGKGLLLKWTRKFDLLSASVRVSSHMKTRLASLFLVLVLAGSASAGLPLPFSADDCDMHSGMDCFKTSRAQSTTPEVADAKLCCAIICAQNGTTSPPNVVRVSSPPSVRASSHPALTHAMPIPALRIHHIDHLHGPPKSEPAYLRNLALLI